MSDKKRFVVIGLGSFGTALALRLTKNGCRVTGVDGDSERVDAVKNEIYEAVIADATDPAALAEIAVADANAVLISLGEEISNSLLAALHAKELGARRIIVKGVSQEHGKLLTHLGVERVVFPEVEAAQELGDRMAWPNVLDFLPIDSEYSVVELSVPESVVGISLREADLRRRFGTWIIGVKDAMSGKLIMFPAPEFKLTDDQLLLAVGKHEEIEQLKKLE